MSKTYKKSGVDIKAGEKAVNKIKNIVKKTHSNSVLKGLGSFGTLFDLTEVRSEYKEPVLVQSIDGVGTKTKIAKKLKKYEGLGRDIVAHSCNDILCQGATPLTFLDYIATSKLDPKIMAEIVKGMAKECKENGVSLIGGETAEMPGVYSKGEWDIVGTILGVVEKADIIDGSKIKKGDLAIGLASNGLHTNGYSLARKLLTKKKDLEELIKPHTNYTKPVLKILEKWPVKGIAHITGGGLVGNVPRILPDNVSLEIEKGSWNILPIFKTIQEKGKISDKDMYGVFNMGIGMVLIVAPEDEGNVENVLSGFDIKYNWIGRIVSGSKKVILK
ncbi:MAG: phosphoribosylformylglycinamidine cyclo-ligase [Patescibacteria group bacterium]